MFTEISNAWEATREAVMLQIQNAQDYYQLSTPDVMMRFRKTPTGMTKCISVLKAFKEQFVARGDSQSAELIDTAITHVQFEKAGLTFNSETLQ